MLLDDTSCNLASINVYKFYNNEDKTFDLEGYIHIVSLVQFILEASIHFGQFLQRNCQENLYV